MSFSAFFCDTHWFGKLTKSYGLYGPIELNKKPLLPVYLLLACLLIVTSSPSPSSTIFASALSTPAPKINYEKVCPDVNVHPPPDWFENVHSQHTPQTQFQRGAGSHTSGSGEIRFPVHFEIYNKNTPYTCKWNFYTRPHSPVSTNQEIDEANDIKIRISFAKFRLDQRCRNYPHMYEPSVTSNFSSCKLISYYDNKYTVDSVNRVLVSNIPLQSGHEGSDKLTKIKTPETTFKQKQPGQELDRDQDEQVGCLCGMSDDAKYVELSDNLKTELYSVDPTHGDENSIDANGGGRREEVDRNSLIHWYTNTLTTKANKGSRGLNVQIYVPYPFLGVSFILKYEYIRVSGCGSLVPMMPPINFAKFKELEKSKKLEFIKETIFKGGFFSFNDIYLQGNGSLNQDPSSSIQNSIADGGSDISAIPKSILTPQINPVPLWGPLICVWNITLPKNLIEDAFGIQKLEDTDYELKLINDTTNDISSQNDTKRDEEDISMSSEDWRLLINYTEFESFDKRMKGSYMYVTNPGMPSSTLALRKLTSDTGSNQAKDNKNQQNKPSLQSRSIDSPLPIESVSNSLIVKLVISPYNHVPAFKIRWSPFLHLSDNESECHEYSVACIDKASEMESFEKIENITSSSSDNNATTSLLSESKATLGGSNVNTSALLENGNQRSIPTFLANKFCIPPELLCNGYVECPNSVFDESPDYCAAYRSKLRKKVNLYHPPIPTSAIFVSSPEKEKLADSISSKDQPNLVNESNNIQVDKPNLAQTNNNGLGVGSKKASLKDRIKAKRSLGLMIGIPLGIICLLLPLIYVLTRKCSNSRKQRYEIAMTSDKLDNNAGHHMKGKSSGDYGKGNRNNNATTRNGYIKSYPDKDIHHGFTQHSKSDIQEYGHQLNGYCNGNALSNGTNKHHRTSKTVIKTEDPNSRNSSYRIPNTAEGLEEETLLATGLKKSSKTAISSPPFIGAKYIFPPAPVLKNRSSRPREIEEIERSETLLPEQNLVKHHKNGDYQHYQTNNTYHTAI